MSSAFKLFSGEENIKFYIEGTHEQFLEMEKCLKVFHKLIYVILLLKEQKKKKESNKL